MKKDNHHSSQNFSLKLIRCKSNLALTTQNKLNKNKSIIDELENKKRKKIFLPMYICDVNNSEYIKKIGDKTKRLKNQFCQSELKKKSFYRKSETQKNYEPKIEIPLMIIRNISFFSPKELKK